ncbi:MAG: FMN-binding protein [Candidatus Omnitrophica bacterium]|nr:FMN-binding protein [Candidatus Omnitrophota bacterium]
MENDKIKKMFAGSVVRMIAALTIVGVMSGASLVFVYNYAMPRIKNNIKEETQKAIKNIFPEAEQIKKEEGYYSVNNSKGDLLGYAFTAEGNGYQGTIKLLAGISPDLLETIGMEVLESQETPGLGAEIATPKFKKQFNGLPIDGNIEYVKNKKPEKPNEIEAIAGATISSRAVVNILNKKIDKMKTIISSVDEGQGK